ncbi:MAG: hypothetical protein GPJ52_04980 [Candidatus Heimdallarchaeota archaeon]|nr:hypothetical protein [Candidatus Heimdallarchaeota archaeon]
MTYVLAIMTCFNENKAKEVQICARGRAISTAVDVAELTRNRFMSELKVKSIITSTEQVVRREGGGVANVSFLIFSCFFLLLFLYLFIGELIRYKLTEKPI